MTKKVLILDDDVVVRNAIAKYLEKENFQILKAASFKEAVQLLSKHQTVDLAVVDYILPDAKDGMAVDYFTMKDIPTILLTATYETKIRHLYNDKKLVDYIFKNIPGALKITVKTIKLFLKYKDCKILIVDDSPTDRKIIRNYLETTRFNALEAHTIKEAEELLKQHSDIKVILLDYNMPGENAFEFIYDVRKKFPRTKLAIIFITGNIDENITPLILKSDANDLIKKPFFREELIGRIFNVFEYMDNYEELEKSALTDPLTGLYNRRCLLKEGKKIISTGVRNNINVAFILLDIDKFKQINDTYGHDVGDAVLSDFSEKLQKFFSREEDLVSRLGGEEFAIITYFNDFEDLKKYIEEFHKFVEENPVYVDSLKKELKYTVSGGVAVYEDGDTLESLYKKADEKLYKAKNDGRNQIIF